MELPLQKMLFRLTAVRCIYIRPSWFK